ncbi:MAG: sulfatase-like hydrolase/transferase [Acidobacteria bacterium]|nr:sulfatase-like hydrolase/transferase [Acidobacteriota bacterium]
MRFLLSLLLLALPALAADRPNIVFLFTDDQAPWAIGLSGNPYAQTPNMDALFQRGAYLTNAFTVTPVCSPSRASLMTSRYGSELGITDWIHPTRDASIGLDPATTTWPEALQKAGYRTGLVGKWHLGVPDQFHPTKTGFDYFMGFREGGTTPSDPLLEKDGKEQRFQGLTVDIFTDHALQFLENNREGPFLLCLFFRSPHAPWLPVADDDWALFENLMPKPPHPNYPNLDTQRVQRMTREYLASVHGVDRNVGRVVEKLEQLGLTDNTVVVYSADHGYNMGHNGIWHKGNGIWLLTKNPPATANIPDGQRPNMYDNSIRVPTAVVWPGVVKPGTRIERTVSNLDWYPTFVEIAGASLPQGEAIRGRSIVPLLKGQKPQWEDEFFAEYSTKHQSHTAMRMWRTKRWKLIRDFIDPSRDELYDLEHDPEETRNRIESPAPEVLAAIEELDAKIRAHLKKTGDPLLQAIER